MAPQQHPSPSPPTAVSATTRAGIPRATPWWAPVALSFGFLTVLPAPAVETNAAVLARAIGFFPIVGIALGGLLGVTGLALDAVFPSGSTASLLLAAGVGLTGGLHLDGLMDTADGVFGGRTVKRRLEIMRDSRVGSFGVLAGILALVGQYTYLAELSGSARLAALVSAYALSRWAMVVALRSFPPARSSGLGATFHAASGRWPLAIATLSAVAVVATIPGPGLTSLGAASITTLLGGRFLTRRLGGLTGDTCGALAVTVETLVLCVAVGFQAGW
jgi:adenosylcobinamide-GDP ribazoletransferase